LDLDHDKERLTVAHKPSIRQMLVSILGLRYGRSQKEIGAALGISEKRVSQYLRRGELKDAEVFERMLAAVDPPPGAVPVVTAGLEALDALDQDGGLTAEERAEIEEGVLAASRIARKTLIEVAFLSRAAPPEGYPRPHEIPHDRRRAEELFGKLERLHEARRPAVIRLGLEYQSWALCERVCLASVREASREVESAAAWAGLAEDIAALVPGPEEWRNRFRGYAAAHGANVLRVSGELKAADAAFEEAKLLWRSGSDPAGVLDPGRLLDLEASLRRDQRRLDEALALLDEAAVVGRCPERALINKGFTLEVLGEYGLAVDTLQQAVPLVDGSSDQRLIYMLRFNLAVNHCHLGRFSEATELLEQVRELAIDQGDQNELIRVTWLAGRIAAGQGRPGEARKLLEEARRELSIRGLSYDVALALLEEAVLLLGEGRTAEVKVLARELTVVFESKGVHREALAALRLFQKAAEREEATAELARRVLRYLFRARYDQGLRFTES
jgi:tetratricopeptide (TPR) repeat protein